MDGSGLGFADSWPWGGAVQHMLLGARQGRRLSRRSAGCPEGVLPALGMPALQGFVDAVPSATCHQGQVTS